MTRGRALRGCRWIAVSCLVLAGVTAAAAQDPAVVAPNQIKVKFENEKVRVLEDYGKPGEKEPMHSHPANVVYVLTGGKIRFNFPDGTTKVSEIKDGDVLYRDAVTHASENIGTTTVHLIIVELKK